MSGAEEATTAAKKAGRWRRFGAPAAEDWWQGGQVWATTSQRALCSLCSFAESCSAAGGADVCGVLGVWPGLVGWRPGGSGMSPALEEAASERVGCFLRGRAAGSGKCLDVSED